jgi:hypothetical protein
LDPNIILDHLALAKGHVRQGTAHVDRQRQLVKDLAHSGHDITQSKMLLRTFEELLELHIQDRDRCRAELAEVMRQLPGVATPSKRISTK